MAAAPTTSASTVSPAQRLWNRDLDHYPATGPRYYYLGIVVVTNAGTIVREARISPGDGWRVLAPGGRAWSPWTALLTAGWMAALFWPFGYLTSVRSRGAVVVAAVSAGVILVSLPIVSGCAWLPLVGWCGAAG